MKLYMKYVAVYLIVQAVIITVFIFIRNDNILHYSNNRLEITKNSFDSTINGFEKSSHYIFESMINTKDVLETFKHRDRKKLYDILIEPYNNLRGLGLKQLHFHLPNGDSFLRFHIPNKYGDNLINVRESVKIANRDRVFVKGFEEGKIFNGYRFVFPLSYNGTHIGSVETSVSMNSILKEMKRSSKDEYTFIIKKNLVEKKLFKDLIEKNYKVSNISKEYMHETSLIIPRDIAEVEQQISKKSADKLAHGKGFVQFSSFHGNSYMSLFIPIHNIKNEQVAYLIVHSKNTIIDKINYSFWFNLIGASISFIMILLFIYQNEIKRLKLKNLNETLEEKVKTKVTEIEAQNDILTKSSKMVVMGEMIGAITHQWKQPLSSLALIIQDLEDTNEFDEISKEYIDHTVHMAMGQITFMSDTIDDFKSFLKPEKEKESFKLNNAVNRVLTLLEKQLAKSLIKYNVNFEEEIEVTTYKGEFEQIILNLVNNAKDAINEKRERDENFEGEITITISKEDDRNTVTVQDNGGGIAENIIDIIFESYFTTKTADHGTGIGLYLSKMVAENSLNGSLTVENRDGGACFKLTF